MRDPYRYGQCHVEFELRTGRTMSMSKQLADSFPTVAEASADGMCPPKLHQRQILVDGELKPWNGPVRNVLSAICARGEDGSLEQIELGSYPVGGTADAEKALAAAVTA